MTNLDVRPVTRETNCAEPCHRRRVLVVRLEVGGKLLRIREKGRRHWYSVPFAEIWRLGVRIRAQEIKEEKKARREARKAGRV